MTQHETDAERPGISSLNSYERETVINASDGDGNVTIWTAQRRYITRLRNNSSFTEVGSGAYGSTTWAEFTITAERWNPATGAKRQGRTLTDEEKILAAQRLAVAREARRAS